MQNPFESGHIKNYVLFYVAIVVIMILFFIASTLFNDVEIMDKKNFFVDDNITSTPDVVQENVEEKKPKFRLLKTGY